MTLTHITIPIAFYALELTEIQRAILSLAYAFRDKGLKMSDQAMADLFGVTRQWINQLIAKLEADDYIKIDKPGSRYRTIYCQL